MPSTTTRTRARVPEPAGRNGFNCNGGARRQHCTMIQARDSMRWPRLSMAQACGSLDGNGSDDVCHDAAARVCRLFVRLKCRALLASRARLAAAHQRHGRVAPGWGLPGTSSSRPSSSPSSSLLSFSSSVVGKSSSLSPSYHVYVAVGLRIRRSCTKSVVHTVLQIHCWRHTIFRRKRCLYLY